MQLKPPKVLEHFEFKGHVLKLVTSHSSTSTHTLPLCIKPGSLLQSAENTSKLDLMPITLAKKLCRPLGKTIKIDLFEIKFYLALSKLNFIYK